jgi:hypothetical protein
VAFTKDPSPVQCDFKFEVRQSAELQTSPLLPMLHLFQVEPAHDSGISEINLTQGKEYIKKEKKVSVYI